MIQRTDIDRIVRAMESMVRVLEIHGAILERIADVLESTAGANNEGEGFWKTVVGNTPRT